MKFNPFLLSAIAISGCAQAQTQTEAVPPVGAKPDVIAAGKGSYASFPPPEVDKQSRATLEKQIYLTPDAVGKPVPTNGWWSNLLVDRYAGQIWAFPHQVKANKDGIELTYPNRWNDSGSDPVSENPLRIEGENFQPVNARAKNWSDWLLTFRLGESDSKFLDVTLGRGLPYVWIEATGVAPRLKVNNDAKFFDLKNAPATLPATTSVIGLTFGGRSYGLFAPDGSQFTQTGDTVSLKFGGTKSFLVICPLPATTDLPLFAKYAYSIPRDSKMTWAYDIPKGEVTTKWHLETQQLQGTEKRLLQGWLPHHYRRTVNDIKFETPTFLTPRGQMKIAAGNDFSITYPFVGIPPVLPAPKKLGLVNDFDEARMRDYIARYATRTEYGSDTYWGGKSLTQFAHYMAIAREMHDPNEAKLRDSLKKALTDWFTYTPGEKEHFFARYPNWKALIGFNTSYGSEAFNDQHFHYGYFTTSAAMLGMTDPQFLKDYGPMVKLVAKQYANWDRADKDFPFLRTFDIWEGHSWAGGFSSGTGNNQESSSEAVQSWAGLFLLGNAMGDAQMTAAGAMGYAIETRATQEYWFNQNGGNWSPNWKHDVVGMVWSGGNNYGTYFSGDPAWIWGIQWLPISPALAYLDEDPAFAKKSFGEMWAARKAKEGDFDISKLGPALGNVILGQAAQVNPDWVAAQMDELWDKNDKVAKDNDTPGLTYYTAHTNRTLGDIAWDYRTSSTMGRVYINPRTKTTTYMAYNPTSTPQTIKVSKAGKALGSFTAAPLGLTSVTQLKP